jgi:hypothetical protein
MTDEQLNQHVDSNSDRIYDLDAGFYSRSWNFLSTGLRNKLVMEVRRKIENNTEVIPRQPSYYDLPMGKHKGENNL